jgi:RNA recognition motif-containing protein
VTDADLTTAVTQYGKVLSARVVTDRETGRSRGFGFVEVEDADSQAVIDAMNGINFRGRPLTVNEAREREQRGGFSGGGRGGSGGGGDRRRY